ncbi:hypothetical protein BR93DRAFT_783596 [Coniochaeta sp. PMI_546]|nr:hypothetical protein BR93DRAFT_783596 [Coniochaeta sp. PMI_546]
MDDDDVYGGPTDGQDSIHEADPYTGYATDSQGVPYNDQATWDIAHPHPGYAIDGQGVPYNDQATYAIARYQTDTSPWSPNNVGSVQGQTRPGSDDYVPSHFPNTSEESIQGSAESTRPVESEEKNGKEDGKKKRERKRGGATDVTKGVKGHSKKDEKDPKSRKKNDSHKKDRQGHGHSRSAA